MKRDRIIYWVATSIVSLSMIMSAYMYLSKNEEVINGFTKQLGFPLFFVTMLGVAKLIGSVILLVPAPARLKEWAYAGFMFTFIGAVWVHIITATPFVAPLIFLLVLAVSYIFWVRSALRTA